jgi:RNA polymerase sigma-70 factor (sigma-E family)
MDAAARAVQRGGSPLVRDPRRGDKVRATGSREVYKEAREVYKEDGIAGAMGFEELAESARPALVRVAQAVTGRREDAEDAVQASLLKAMGAWPRVAGQERWRQQAYVRQIVVNTCRSSWRKWGSRVSVGDLPELVQVPKTDDVDDRELVRQALARLPSRQREVLLLRYYQDLSEAEIAKRLGCAPGTVKSSAARALRALRDMLPEYESAGLDRLPVPAAVGQRTGPRPVLRGVVRRAAPGDEVVVAAESA